MVAGPGGAVQFAVKPDWVKLFAAVAAGAAAMVVKVVSAVDDVEGWSW